MKYLRDYILESLAKIRINSRGAMNTKKQSKIRLQISGIYDKSKTEFIAFSKAKGVTYHETFETIWQLFKSLPFTKEEAACTAKYIEKISYIAIFNTFLLASEGKAW